MLRKGSVFKHDVRPLLLPKRGPHIYKEGKEKQARGLPRAGKQEEGGPAPQGDTGPCRHEVSMPQNKRSANVSDKTEKKNPVLLLGMNSLWNTM